MLFFSLEPVPFTATMLTSVTLRRMEKKRKKEKKNNTQHQHVRYASKMQMQID